MKFTSWFAAALVAFSVWTANSFAFNAEDLPWDEAQKELGEELKTFEGEWSDKYSWRGFPCGGSVSYRFNVSAKVANLDLNLTEAGTLEINVELKDVRTHAEGKYRSAATLCADAKAWLGASSDWAKIRAVGSFPENSKELKDIRLDIKSTEMGPLHLGLWVPPSFETYLTAQLNRGLQAVWHSCLGTHLNRLIGKMIRKKFPTEEFEPLSPMAMNQ